MPIIYTINKIIDALPSQLIYIINYIIFICKYK